MNIRTWIQFKLAAGTLAVGGAHAATAEPGPAARAASGAVTKAETAVKRGAKAAEKRIQTGVGAANRGADMVGSKVGLPTGKPPPEPKAP